MTSQEQKGGIGSTNVQVGTVTVGMSYSEVKDLATMVFNENAAQLRNQAAEVAGKRVEDLRESLVEYLKKKNIEDLNGFKHPEKQIALLDAQKAYALSGDADLRNMLIDSIANLAKEPERSLKSIVLQEAIKAMPSLTHRQLKALSIAFMVRMVSFNAIIRPDQIFSVYEQGLGGISDLDHLTDGDFRHLEYCRCGMVELGAVSFSHALTQTYPGLYMKGLTGDAMLAAFGTVPFAPRAVAPSFWDENKFQIAGPNETFIRLVAESLGLTEEQTRVSCDIMRKNTMSEDELRATVPALSETAAKIFDKWDNTSLKSLKLTSVGIAVAHSFCVANGLQLADLSIWI